MRQAPADASTMAASIAAVEDASGSELASGVDVGAVADRGADGAVGTEFAVEVDGNGGAGASCRPPLHALEQSITRHTAHRKQSCVTEATRSAANS